MDETPSPPTGRWANRKSRPGFHHKAVARISCCLIGVGVLCLAMGILILVPSLLNLDWYEGSRFKRNIDMESYYDSNFWNRQEQDIAKGESISRHAISQEEILGSEARKSSWRNSYRESGDQTTKSATTAYSASTPSTIVSFTGDYIFDYWEDDTDWMEDHQNVKQTTAATTSSPHLSTPMYPLEYGDYRAWNDGREESNNWNQHDEEGNVDSVPQPFLTAARQPDNRNLGDLFEDDGRDVSDDYVDDYRDHWPDSMERPDDPWPYMSYGHYGPDYSSLVYITPGTWAGIMFIASGIIGLLSAKWRTNCLIVSMMVMTVVTALTAVSCTVLSVLAQLDITPELNATLVGVRLAHGFIGFTAILAFIFSCIQFGFACRAVCCNGRRPRIRITERQYRYQTLPSAKPNTVFDTQGETAKGLAISPHPGVPLLSTEQPIYLVQGYRVIGVLSQNCASPVASCNSSASGTDTEAMDIA